MFDGIYPCIGIYFFKSAMKNMRRLHKIRSRTVTCIYHFTNVPEVLHPEGLQEVH